MSATQTYSLAVLLDEKRLKAVKGTKLEGLLTNMFGGAIKAFILSVPADQTKTLLSEFPRSRTDARGSSRSSRWPSRGPSSRRWCAQTPWARWRWAR